MTSGEKIILFITLSIGMLFLTLGSYFYSATKTFLEKSISVEGSVVNLEKREGTLRPWVEYVDHQGISRIHYSSMGTNPPAYFVGENVHILYDPKDPRYPANSRIDSKLGVWGVPVFFLSMGSFFIFVAFLVWYVINYHGGVWLFRKKDRLEFERTDRMDHNL